MTLNGFKVVSIAVYETSDAGLVLDTTWGAALDQARAPLVGSIVTHSLLTDLRALEETLWSQHRPIVAAWSGADFGTPGDAKTITGTTTPTNLITGTGTSRTASSAGEICPAQYVGRGALGYVTARGFVYAGASAGSGVVNFVSSRNTVATAGIAGTAWYSTAATLELDTTIEYDKVDLLGAPDNAANTLYVWAWGIQIEPT